jgi:hypothetical protein
VSSDLLLNVLFLIEKEPVNRMERLDRSQWKQYQNVMQDSIKFVELLHNIDYEDGLSTEVMLGKNPFIVVSSIVKIDEV